MPATLAADLQQIVASVDGRSNLGGRVGVAADELARVPTGSRKDFLLKFANSRLHNL